MTNPGRSQSRVNCAAARGLALMAVILAAQTLMWAETVKAQPVTAAGLLECVNAIREESGIAPLVLNGSLNMAAAMKLDDMKRYGYWSHSNPETGSKPWDFVEAAGYRYVETGENLAIGYPDSESVCAGWKTSSVHFSNMVNGHFDEAGIAVDSVEIDGGARGILAVMMFGAQNLTADGRLSAEVGTTDRSPDFFGMRLRSIVAFAIMLLYISTFVAFLNNYLARKRSGTLRYGELALFVLAGLSVLLTLAFFFLIM